MKVRTRLELSGGFLICVAVALGVVLALMAGRSGDAQRKAWMANQIVKGVFELSTLTNEYLMHHEERVSAQWRTRHSSLGALLEREEFEGAEETALLEKIREAHAETKAFFARLEAVHQEAGRDGARSAELERRLAGRLMVASRLMVLNAQALAQISADRIASTQRSMISVIFASALGMACIVAVNYALMIRSISRPIARLHEGTEVIGAGNLDFRVGTSANDEIGQLSRAFDSMTANLKRVMTSRDLLEEEIAQRRRAEEALRVSEAKFRELFDDAPVGYHEIDPAGRITRVNHTELNMLGYTAEEMLGRPVWEFVADGGRSREAVAAKVKAPAKFNEPFERTYRRKDGRRLPVLVEDRFLTDETGKLVGIRSTIQDISALKRAERRLKHTLAELERSNKELEMFAYVASHDLQEPLRMVSSFVKLLERRYKGKLDADADEFIRYAVEGAERMADLINSLLAYSRVGTRGKPPQPVDAQDVLEDAIDNLKEAIEESGAQITHDPLPTILADKTQIGQLLQNLLANAIKFRGDRRPRIHVGVEKVDRRWRFSVKDNGIGIDPRYADRIFLIFQRLHGRGEYPGTGIGLAVCKKIVERHEGRIWVESRPGQGSTFYFTIPERPRGRDDEPAGSETD